MAVTHVTYATGGALGAPLSTALRQLEESLDALNKLRATLELMIDGDGSSAAHFAYMQTKLGTADAASAKAIYEELASGLAKLNTDASVSNVHAAITQLFNKLRQG